MEQPIKKLTLTAEERFLENRPNHLETLVKIEIGIYIDSLRYTCGQFGIPDIKQAYKMDRNIHNVRNYLIDHVFKALNNELENPYCHPTKDVKMHLIRKQLPNITSKRETVSEKRLHINRIVQNGIDTYKDN